MKGGRTFYRESRSRVSGLSFKVGAREGRPSDLDKGHRVKKEEIQSDKDARSNKESVC